MSALEKRRKGVRPRTNRRTIWSCHRAVTQDSQAKLGQYLAQSNRSNVDFRLTCHSRMTVKSLNTCHSEKLQSVYKPETTAEPTSVTQADRLRLEQREKIKRLTKVLSCYKFRRRGNRPTPCYVDTCRQLFSPDGKS